MKSQTRKFPIQKRKFHFSKQHRIKYIQWILTKFLQHNSYWGNCFSRKFQLCKWNSLQETKGNANKNFEGRFLKTLKSRKFSDKSFISFFVSGRISIIQKALERWCFVEQNDFFFSFLSLFVFVLLMNNSLRRGKKKCKNGNDFF